MEKSLQAFLNKRQKKWAGNKNSKVSNCITVKYGGRNFTWYGLVEARDPNNVHVTLHPPHGEQVVRVASKFWSDIQLIEMLNY